MGGCVCARMSACLCVVLFLCDGVLSLFLSTTRLMLCVATLKCAGKHDVIKRRQRMAKSYSGQKNFVEWACIKDLSLNVCVSHYFEFCCGLHAVWSSTMNLFATCAQLHPEQLPLSSAVKTTESTSYLHQGSTHENDLHTTFTEFPLRHKCYM